MKNLVVETQKVTKYSANHFPRNKYYSCYNPGNDRYYVIDKETCNLISLDIANDKRHTNQVIYSENVEVEPVGIEYCSVTEEFFVAFDYGVVSCVTHTEEHKIKYENIADFRNGLQCIKVSPDHEMVVLVTRDDIVITLTSNFDILKEVSLRSSQFGEKEFVTVGWGKKETQFHGSEGKTAAKAKLVIYGKTDTDDGMARVTWKGDGSMFAVSYIDIEANARRFKVFDREGALQYTSELVDSLEAPFAWKPSGNLIASTRKLPNKRTVALFEKNGLLHREFTLPFGKKNIEIVDLIWSPDSDVLAIWFKDVDNNVATVQLWAEKNYHWYLKQTITYPKNVSIIYVTWSQETNKELMILSSKNSTIYTFHWTVSCSRGKDETDKAVVGVIDGNKVLVTCFRDCVVPPPMAQQTLEFKEPVNAIAFAPYSKENSEISTNDFMVVLSNNKIIHCKYVNESSENQYIQYKAYNIDFRLMDANNYSFHLIQHLVWYKPNILLCSVSLSLNSHLYRIDLMDIEGLDVLLIDATSVQEMSGQIEHTTPSADSKAAYLVVKGQLYSFIDIYGVRRSDLKINVDGPPKRLLRLEQVEFGDQEVLVCLTRKHALLVDGRQVGNNVSSLVVHSGFLLLTTLQHALISYRLDSRGLEQLRAGALLNLQPWEDKKQAPSAARPTAQETNVRRVERGSLLVTAVPTGSRTVLQMPRGNLECIEPRALSLAIIAGNLERLEYRAAFELMRRQRIDLNLIHDFSPEAFDRNAEKLVDDLNNASWLSLFLTELRDEDVTQTSYAGCFELHQPWDTAGKTEKVCNRLRARLEQESDKYIQPILIGLVKSQKKTGLEAALRKVKELMSKERESEGASISADEALKYLLYMVDVNMLYDVALGMYDFELVLFVAQHSLKDPKEYLPFLNGLKSLDEQRMKYEINRLLKRHDAALEHAAQLPERFDDCLAFVESQHLHARALRVFQSGTEQYRRLALSYANSLQERAKYREAGIMFVKAASFEEALNAFKQAGCWRDAVYVAAKLNWSSRQLSTLYEELATQLQQDKRFEEAALVLSKYLVRQEDAVAVLCEGRHWNQAWSEAHSMRREDLIETHVKPGIFEHGEFLLGQLRERRQEFHKHRTRLAQVRAQPPRPAELGIEDDQGRGEFSDLVSEASSVAGSTVSRASSRASGRSYRSSKNRRKHERKLQSIKEGGVYEDLALIRALHRLVTQAYQTREEVKSIAEMLLYVDGDKLAGELYDELQEYLKDIRTNKREIWPPVDENKDDSKPSTSTNSPAHESLVSNVDLIEPHLLQPPEEKPSDWKLDMFLVS